MEYVLNGEELLLLLASLIRRTRPEMLTEDQEDFVVDFTPIQDAPQPLTGDDATLDKFRAGLASEPSDHVYHLDFDTSEARRLSQVLEELETLEGLEPGVLTLSRSLRARLQTGIYPA